MKVFRAALAAALFACAWAHADESAGHFYVPYRASGIYAAGEPVGWHVTLPWSAPAVSYVIRKDNQLELGRGSIKPGVPARIEVKLDQPGMVFVEVIERTANAKPRALGAQVSRLQLSQPTTGPPNTRETAVATTPSNSAAEVGKNHGLATIFRIAGDCTAAHKPTIDGPLLYLFSRLSHLLR